MENLSAAHTFNYIVFKINPGLTSFKDPANVLDNSLDNKLVPVMLAMFYHIDVAMSEIINLCFYHSHANYRIAILIQSVI